MDAKEIQKLIERLPSPAREFLYSPEFSSIINSIGQKNQLHIDQIGDMEAEVSAAIMGITRLENFSENISEVLNIDKDKAIAITKDVNEKIFIKIQDTMKVSPATSPASTPTSGINTVPVKKLPEIAPVAAPQVSTPATSPAAAAPMPAPVPAPVTTPAPKPINVAAETILTQPTSSVAPSTSSGQVPQKPEEKPITKIDPYREPIE